MKLKSITINNYKSIDELTIPINKIEDESYTYGLIGVNESGKSTILSAISLIDNFQDQDLKPTISDYRIKTLPIEVCFKYEISMEEASTFQFESNNTIVNYIFKLNSKKLSSPLYSLESKNSISGSITIYQPNSQQYQIFNKERHKTIFWKHDPKYLIEKEVVFQAQSAAQTINQNIPLKNCFRLAKIDLTEFSQNVIDSAEREAYQEQLSEEVTNFVKKMWPNKKLKIKFNLTESKINFHIRDGRKSQKINQRSDGFRQFLSFLLSISFENITSQLENTIILLDEPEVHLHPQAQLYFLDEIINLSKSQNNILLFSTHSPFLIDKKNIERNAKVEKFDEKTSINFFKQGDYSYARINFEVFETEAEGFHNELYGKIEADGFLSEFKEVIRGTNRKYIKILKNKDEKEIQITRSEYIRHQIHHPENKKNKKFSNEEIKKSIHDMNLFLNKKELSN